MYELRTPAVSLRRFIEHYWFLSHGPGAPVEVHVDVFVDARADLIFNFGVPYRREVIGGVVTLHEQSNLDAQRLVPIRIVQRGSVRAAGVRFHLGGLGAFVATELQSLTNQTPAPRDVFGPDVDSLQQTLSQTEDLDESARALDSFFLSRLECGGAYAVFERALSTLRETHGSASVENGARAAGVSSRQVERMFARYLGIPPKTVGRVLRFQRALRGLMRDPGCALVHIAAEAGYHDQAHFIREFKKLSGGVPRGYRGYYPPAGPSDFAPNVVAFVQDGGPRSADPGPRSRQRIRRVEEST